MNSYILYRCSKQYLWLYIPDISHSLPSIIWIYSGILNATCLCIHSLIFSQNHLFLMTFLLFLNIIQKAENLGGFERFQRRPKILMIKGSRGYFGERREWKQCSDHPLFFIWRQRSVVDREKYRNKRDLPWCWLASQTPTDDTVRPKSRNGNSVQVSYAHDRNPTTWASICCVPQPVITENWDWKIWSGPEHQYSSMGCRHLNSCLNC